MPPTARKARTGEFTPPGVTWEARSKSDCETGASYEYDTWVLTCENEWADGWCGRHRRRSGGTVPQRWGEPCSLSRHPVSRQSAGRPCFGAMPSLTILFHKDVPPLGRS
ncbi:hypothetical protein GCM10010249_08360 [Streptomyces roseolilacinus]|uniref:Uncharacterized protein n=1 Tax=Streptomyces roseolilacinus TaxID=66904 RepID=A0A918EJN5_9ACTN|nr:hypothetical protein GCM10010249_08360 [Streptomyces roseolilacinus]